MGHIIIKFSMNRGAPTWLKNLELWCGIYRLLNHVFIEIKIKKTKIDNYVRIWERFCYYWKALAKFDLIMLIP
jgi:hypothetical protein